MRKFAKWFCYITAPIALIAVVVLWLYVAVLPGMVRSRLIEAMQDIGLEGATAADVAVSTDHAVVSNLSLGGDEHSIDTVAVTYRLGDALDGRVKDVHISGARYRVNLTPDGIDWGPLLGLNVPEGEPGAKPPFESLHLRNCVIELASGDQVYALPFDASVTPGGPDTYAVQLHPRVAGMAVSMAGEIKLEGEGEGQSLIASLAATDAKTPWPIQPETLDVEYLLATGAVNADASVVTPWGPRKVNVSRVKAASTADDGDSAEAEAEPPTDRWTATAVSPDGRITWNASVEPRDEQMLRVTLGLESAELITQALGDWQAELKAARWAGDITLGKPWRVDGRLQSSAVTLRSGELFETTAALDVPVTWRAHTAPDDETNAANLITGPITVQGRQLAGFAARTRFDDGVLTFDTNWSPITGVAATIDGALDVTSGSPRGTIAIVAPDIDLAGSSVASLARDLTKIHVSGKASMGGDVRVDGSTIKPNLTLSLSSVDASSKTYDIDARGLSGKIALTSLDPIATPGNQRFTLRTLRVGNFIVDNADFALRVESPESIFVERVKGTWREGGDFRVRAFRINRNKPVIDTDLFFEELDLGGVLALIPSRQATGQGKLFGRVPVTIRPTGKPVMQLDAGFLYSKPGADGGTLQFRQEDLLETALQNVPDASVRKQIIAALKDFTYKNLRFDLIRKDDGTITCRIHVEGEGRNGKTPINLTVNLNNFGELVEKAVVFKRGTDKAMDAALDRMLPGF